MGHGIQEVSGSIPLISTNNTGILRSQDRRIFVLLRGGVAGTNRQLLLISNLSEA